MEERKPSKLPVLSGINPPKTNTKPLTTNKSNAQGINLFAKPSAGLASRRSTSMTDLRSMSAKPRMVSKFNVAHTTQQNPIKSAPKRKNENGTDGVKPKIAKQPKIPDWDYKARFNQLRERYTLLQDEHKMQSSKWTVVKDLEKRYEEINNQHQVLQNKYATLSNTNLDLINENALLKDKNAELDSALCDVNRSLEELKQIYNTLFAKEKLSSENVEKLTCENGELNRSLQNLKEDHIQLKNEYQKVLKDLYNGEILRRKLHNRVQDLKGNIRVFCRVRPPVSTEEELRLQCMINFIDENSIEIRKSRESVSAISGKPIDIKLEFLLDKVFAPNSSQLDIFEDISQLVQSAIDGYDICVFAYGQTGSGKTYTMQGGEIPDQAGMIPRTIDSLFDSINNLKRAGWWYEVKASFLEIYNEQVHDLLNPDCENLEIRYNEGKGITVTNLTIRPVSSASELKQWMSVAHRNRAVAATNFNEHSSRSHAVTKIHLHGINNDMDVIYTGSVNLVDLAGSESAKTSANERLLETKNINKSLSTLGNVMLALYNKEKHIPYRNSKLTYLLQSCLGGNSKTLMIVNIAPFEDCYAESINSLRFASKVKEVKMSAKRNKANLSTAASTVSLT